MYWFRRNITPKLGEKGKKVVLKTYLTEETMKANLVLLSCLLVVGLSVGAAIQEQDWNKAEAAFKDKLLKERFKIEEIKVDAFKEHRFFTVSVKLPARGASWRPGGEDKEEDHSLGTLALKIDGTTKEIKTFENIKELAKTEKLKLTEETVKSLALFCERFATTKSIGGIRPTSTGQKDPEREVREVKKESNAYTAKVAPKSGDEDRRNYIIKTYGLQILYTFTVNDQGELQDVKREEKHSFEDWMKANEDKLKKEWEDRMSDKKKEPGDKKHDDRKKEMEDKLKDLRDKKDKKDDNEKKELKMDKMFKMEVIRPGEQEEKKEEK
jgi:hypothetical protein